MNDFRNVEMAELRRYFEGRAVNILQRRRRMESKMWLSSRNMEAQELAANADLRTDLGILDGTYRRNRERIRRNETRRLPGEAHSLPPQSGGVQVVTLAQRLRGREF